MTLMRSTMILLLASGIASDAVARQAQPQPRPKSSEPYRASTKSTASGTLPNTEALFDAYVRADKMPGIVGAFGSGDRPTMFVDAGRIADEAAAPKAGPDSLWRIYSMTKPITAMAAMILIEEGKIGLDDPVSKYIPAFRNMRVLTSPDASLDSVPAVRAITIRNLLTHTAGLGYNIITKGPLLKRYEAEGILPGSVNAKTEVEMRKVRPKTLAEFADRVAKLPLIAQPGTKWSYSIGLDVLGRVIEVASGVPFDRFLQNRIFTPLKMDSTGFTVKADEVSRLATNYTFIGDVRVPIDTGARSVFLQPPSFPYGGAGLVSSARDYDRFLHMLQDGGELDGVRILKPETVRLAMSNMLPAGVKFGGMDGTATREPTGFGAGGSVYLNDMPGGAGKGTYGWGGAAGTIAWVDPIRHTRATVMVDYFPADRWPLRRDIPAALMKDAAGSAR